MSESAKRRKPEESGRNKARSAKRGTTSSQSPVPPHRRIQQELRSLLRDPRFTPHKAFPSEVELCDRFKVNVATVRKAVRGLTDEGLLYKIHRKGTFVAPPSRQKLILFVTTELSFSTVGRLTPVASQYPTFQWLELHVDDLRPILPDILHVFPRLTGVFFVRDLPRSVDVIRGVQTQGIPTFFYGSDAHTPFLDRTHSLLYRESEMCNMVLDHLRECGCRRIGFLGTHERQVFSVRHENFRGWMDRNGFEEKLANVINLPAAELFNPGKCYAAIRSHLSAKDFDADGFFCANEACSSVFVQAAASARVRVPTRLKVAGIEDDARLTEHVFPQVTSVRIPFDDDIRESFRMLTGISKDEKKILRKWSMPQLIRRQST